MKVAERRKKRIPALCRAAGLALAIALALALAGCGSAPEDDGTSPPPDGGNGPSVVADAGPFQTVAREGQVTLDGGRSLAGGAVPAFSWVFTERPRGSAAALDAADVASPTFVADQIGRYRARLVVSDGTRESEAVFTEVRAQAGFANRPPAARVTAPVTVPVGTLVELDGTASRDPEGRPIGYSWALLERPSGSAARLEVTVPVGTLARFRADVAGKYRVQLVVFELLSDGRTINSPAAEVSVTASP